MRTLFGKNICENERNGSCWGARASSAPPPDPPMNKVHLQQRKCKKVSYVTVIYTTMTANIGENTTSHRGCPVADPEICPMGAQWLAKLAAQCGGHLFLTSFNRGRGDRVSGPPGSATGVINLAVIGYDGHKVWLTIVRNPPPPDPSLVFASGGVFATCNIFATSLKVWNF